MEMLAKNKYFIVGSLILFVLPSLGWHAYQNWNYVQAAQASDEFTPFTVHLTELVRVGGPSRVVRY